jgi:Zn-dependent protease with chaperone function
MSHQWRSLIALLFSGLVLVGCKTENTTQTGVVGVNREQRMAISSATMVSAATKQYAQLMADAQKNGKLNADAAQSSRVKTIADRLIAQTRVFRSDALNWTWEVNVITSPEVNAWCMPGGKIAVYTGLIEKLRLTDDELAAVMGHEVSHALREHSRERASEQAVASIGISVVAAACPTRVPMKLKPIAWGWSWRHVRATTRVLR